MKRMELQGGTWLVGRPDGAWVWHPAERVVNVALGDGRVRLTADGAPEEILADLAIVLEKGPGKPARGQHEEQTTAGKPTGRPGRSDDDGGRWQTLNEFVDKILPAVQPTDAVVWLVLYRRASASGKVLATNRGLAEKANVGLRSVARSLARLKQAGLVVEERMSMHKSDGASEYRLNVRPGRCVADPKRPRKPRPR